VNGEVIGWYHPGMTRPNRYWCPRIRQRLKYVINTGVLVMWPTLYRQIRRMNKVKLGRSRWIKWTIRLSFQVSCIISLFVTNSTTPSVFPSFINTWTVKFFFSKFKINNIMHLTEPETKTHSGACNRRRKSNSENKIKLKLVNRKTVDNRSKVGIAILTRL